MTSYARLRRNRNLLLTNVIYLFKNNTHGETRVPFAHWVNAGEAVYTL